MSENGNRQALRPKRRRPLRVVVVESHQHVLPHVHETLRDALRDKFRDERRRRRRAGGGSEAVGLGLRWRVIHLDSHPDLACPGSHVPAAACFAPRREWPSCRQAPGVDRGGGSVVDGVEAPDGDSMGICSDSADTGLNDNEEEVGGLNLYDLLDSTTSGIAEWILPLVLAGGLDEVRWIRSRELGCDQFEDGVYNLRVGAWASSASSTEEEPVEGSREGEPPFVAEGSVKPVDTFLDLPDDAVLKVDLNHPYYWDDGSVVPMDELLLSKGMKLVVSELGSPANSAKDVKENNATVRGSTAGKILGVDCDNTANDDNDSYIRKDEGASHDGWALDICLDYFLVVNPFVADLEKIDPDFARTLVDAAAKMRCRSVAPRSGGCRAEVSLSFKDEGESYQEQMRSFHRRMEEFLRSFIRVDSGNGPQSGSALCSGTIDTAGSGACVDGTLSRQFDALLSLYSSFAEGESILHHLSASLTKSGTRPPYEVAKLAEMGIEALPTISMPHTWGLHDAARRARALEGALKMVERTGEALRRPPPSWGLPSSDDPMLITVARSALDGFIPVGTADRLQDAVLREVHCTYCVCEGDGNGDDECCCVEMVRDYEQEEDES